jgi:hypothetical protein
VDFKKEPAGMLKRTLSPVLQPGVCSTFTTVPAPDSNLHSALDGQEAQADDLSTLTQADRSSVFSTTPCSVSCIVTPKP